MKWMKYSAMMIMLISISSFAGKKNEPKTSQGSGIIAENHTTGSFEITQGGTVPKLLEKILALNKARIGNSEQIVLVTNKYLTEWEVNVQTFEKTNGQWVEKLTSTSGTIGVEGFARYKEKKEGDKKTPTGIFFLGPVYGYPGVKVTTKMTYWVATQKDFWIDDVESKQYNRWVTSDNDPKIQGISREEMLRKNDRKYEYGICVQYNMDQIKGKGSVITVHVLESKNKTLGCVAVPKGELIEIIGWLDPKKKPLIITGTKDELLTKPVSAPALDNNDKYIWKKEIFLPPVK
jgi:L,D-peptidoglycan transpeptidase YkuD (ErfK/YbiS/YcfS/YnhG family)